MLDGKIALVIGGTARDGFSSIGAAMAHFLADEGALTLPSSRSREKVEATMRALAERRTRNVGADTSCDTVQKPERLSLMRVDVTRLTFDARDEKALTECCDYIESELGPIDILINAQGIILRKPAEETSSEEWESIVSVNLLSVALACRVVGGRMLKRRRGHIINVASETSLQAFPEVAAYGASKGGVRALTAHLAVEWAKHGICVNAIAPGVIITDINREILNRDPQRREKIVAATPAARLGELEDLRQATIFLATCTNYVNGIILPVDGGISIAAFT